MKYESKFKTGDEVIIIRHERFIDKYKENKGYTFQKGYIGEVIFGHDTPYYGVSCCKDKKICETDVFAINDTDNLFMRMYELLKEENND